MTKSERFHSLFRYNSIGTGRTNIVDILIAPFIGSMIGAGDVNDDAGFDWPSRYGRGTFPEMMETTLQNLGYAIVYGVGTSIKRAYRWTDENDYMPQNAIDKSNRTSLT